MLQPATDPKEKLEAERETGSEIKIRGTKQIFKMTITDTYLVRPQEREIFEENCKKCDVKIVSSITESAEYDLYTLQGYRIGDFIRLGFFMALDQLNQKR